MSLPRNSNHEYLIPVLSRALDIVEFLQLENQPITLEAIYRQTNIARTTGYRILKTLVQRGYLVQSLDGLYRHVAQIKKVRFGLAEQNSDMPFSASVIESLKGAASRAGVELIILDNSCDAATTVRNVEEFVCSRVNLVIELEAEQEVGPIIGARLAEAKIPFIAIDAQHPQAVYFGVDNYRVGFEAGQMLASHAIDHWGNKVDWVIGLDVPELGLLVQSRITGAFEGIRNKLPVIPTGLFVRLDGRGMRDQSQKVVSDFLRLHPKHKHILIAAATDEGALGAVDAVKVQKRCGHAAIVGQSGIAEAVLEMRELHSPLIGSVSHEAAAYGPNLIDLGLSILSGQVVKPYNYVEHKLMTREFPP